MLLNRAPLSLLLGWYLLFGQCPDPSTLPSAPTCENCKPLEVDVGGNASIPRGQTRCVRASTALRVNSLNFGNNSHLIVCGELALNGWANLNNGDAIYVAASGRFIAQGANINAGSAFYNYGMTELSGSLNLNGASSRFLNLGGSAHLRVGGDISVNSSDGLINYGGRIEANHLRINGSGSICASGGACFSMPYLTSNGNNKINVVGTQPVVVHYTGQATLNGGSLTNSSQLMVCQAPNSTFSGSGSWGQAQVVPQCNQGCGILPFMRLTGEGKLQNEGIFLRWQLEGKLPEGEIVFQISLWQSETLHFLQRTSQTLWEIPLQNLPKQEKWIFYIEAFTERSTKVAEGSIQVVNVSQVPLRVYPTAFREALHYESDEAYQALLMNAAGQVVARLHAQAGQGIWHQDAEGKPLETLPSGLYFLQAEGVPPLRLYKLP